MPAREVRSGRHILNDAGLIVRHLQAQKIAPCTTIGPQYLGGKDAQVRNAVGIDWDFSNNGIGRVRRHQNGLMLYAAQEHAIPRRPEHPVVRFRRTACEHDLSRLRTNETRHAFARIFDDPSRIPAFTVNRRCIARLLQRVDHCRTRLWTDAAPSRCNRDSSASPSSHHLRGFGKRARHHVVQRYAAQKNLDVLAERPPQPMR